MFLSGAVPKEEDDIQIVVEDTKKSKGEAKIDTTQSALEQAKRKEDLRQYVLDEYSGILGQDTKLKDNIFYKNHLRALELKRQEEEQEREAGKVLIMQFAEQM